MLDKTPAYNLKAVLRETGLSAATLRAWERRYGLPMPARTRGGQRLYSAYDLAILRWLKSKITEGLTISRAVHLWRQTLASGRDPLAEIAHPTLPPPSLKAAKQAWIQACVRLDEQRAEDVLNQAFSLLTVERVCLDLLSDGLADIGDLWYRGIATVQHEHFASQLATRRLDALLVTCPPPVRREKVLVACPPEEWHTFPLLLIAVLLRRRGWGVVYLGANVPLDRMLETTQGLHPALVLLGTQHLVSAARLREMAGAVARAGFPVAYGGRAPNLIRPMRDLIPAHFLGESIEEAVDRAESLLASSSPPPVATEIPPQSADLARSFRQRRAHLEAALSENLETAGLSIPHVEAANEFLGDRLTAALDFAAPEFLEGDLAWLAASLPGGGVDRPLLPLYLRHYARAARRALGEPIAATADWLEQIAASLETGGKPESE